MSNNQRPPRDWYDKWLFAIQAGGLAAVVATIVIGHYYNASNGRDMAAALNRMADISDSLLRQRDQMANQVSALNNQVDAIRSTTSATRDLVGETSQQVASSVRSVGEAQRANGIAQQGLQTSVNLLKFQQSSSLALIGEYLGQIGPNLLASTVTVKSTGGPPIFKARVRNAMAIIPYSEATKPYRKDNVIFGYLATKKRPHGDGHYSPVFEDTATIVYGDAPHLFNGKIDDFTEADLITLRGHGAVVIAASVNYVDQGGHTHFRYSCDVYAQTTQGFEGKVCPTPPER